MFVWNFPKILLSCAYFWVRSLNYGLTRIKFSEASLYFQDAKSGKRFPVSLFRNLYSPAEYIWTNFSSFVKPIQCFSEGPAVQPAVVSPLNRAATIDDSSKVEPIVFSTNTPIKWWQPNVTDEIERVSALHVVSPKTKMELADVEEIKRLENPKLENHNTFVAEQTGGQQNPISCACWNILRIPSLFCRCKFF